MILFAWGLNSAVPDRCTLKGRRWALETRPWDGIGVSQQYLWDDRWSSMGSYYWLFFGQWRGFGRGHAYYDGPHDTINIGFAQIGWSGEWCDECMPSTQDPARAGGRRGGRE